VGGSSAWDAFDSAHNGDVVLTKFEAGITKLQPTDNELKNIVNNRTQQVFIMSLSLFGHNLNITAPLSMFLVTSLLGLSIVGGR
jgi:hypothetical protein